jgi:hypothetical protein
MTFEQAQSQAIRTKDYFPFRIVWIKEVDNGADYEVYAKTTKHGLNKAMREGCKVWVVGK